MNSMVIFQFVTLVYQRVDPARSHKNGGLASRVLVCLQLLGVFMEGLAIHHFIARIAPPDHWILGDKKKVGVPTQKHEFATYHLVI